MKAKIISFEKYKKRSVKSMSYKENKETTYISYSDLKDKHASIIEDNWALRAFAVLLEDSTFDHFSNASNGNSERYKYGLRRMVECYLDHQERKINEIQLNASGNPDEFINQIKLICARLNSGSYKDVMEKTELIKNGLNKANMLITEFGVKYKNIEQLRDNLLNIRDNEAIKMKMSA